MSTITSDFDQLNKRFSIIIPGDPLSQKRHRHRKAGARVITYDPSSKDKKTVEQILGLVFKKKNKYSEPLSVEINANFTPPKSWSNKKKEEAYQNWRPKKPDFDNIAKLYCDAMNGLVYDDDNQIVRATVTKRYCQQASVEIIVQPI